MENEGQAIQLINDERQTLYPDLLPQACPQLKGEPVLGMPHSDACWDSGRCKPVEAGVRTVDVVVDPPCFDVSACLVEIG